VSLAKSGLKSNELRRRCARKGQCREKTTVYDSLGERSYSKKEGEGKDEI